MKWTGPFEIVNATGRAPLVIACDHASNAVPPEIGNLGVSDADMQRHIAWDIGAAAISRHLARAFDAPAILSGTSRLVIDCNRQLRDPTLIPVSSDGTPLPANEGALCRSSARTGFLLTSTAITTPAGRSSQRSAGPASGHCFSRFIR